MRTGVFYEQYLSEERMWNTPVKRWWVAVLVVLLLTLPFWSTKYLLAMACIIGIHVIATLGLAYSTELGNGWGLDANWDTTYEGARFVQVHNLARYGASTLSNFRVSVSPNDAWRITAYVNNVFDDDTPQAGLRYLSFSGPRISIPNAAPAAGRALAQLLSEIDRLPPDTLTDQVVS